jgi:DNA-binding transcriptional ArsR family regulator
MEIMVMVNKRRFESPIQKLIFLQLADNANKDGKCWPSYQYIADTSGCGKSTVRKHLKLLEKMGFLTIQNRKGEKGNSSNYYQINKHKLAHDPVAPDSTGGCYQIAQGVAPDSIPPVAPDSTRTSNSLEPVNKEKKNTKKKSFQIIQPDNLNQSAWSDWIDYKKQIKKPYKTGRGMQTAMNQLAELSHDQQRACIDSSIANEYQGFFTDKFRGSKNANNTKESTFEREERHHREYLRERERLVGSDAQQISELVGGAQRGKLL